MPEPVTFAVAMQDLQTHGACIIPDALSPDILAQVRTATYHAADNDRRYGWAQDYDLGRDDHINQRVWNLPSRDPVFAALAEHSLAIDVVKHVLGWPASLSSMAANITHQDGSSMLVHTDQGYLPGPLDRPWVYNLGWCVDDFTAENGATLYLPGSHLTDGPPPPDAVDHMIPALAPAGSLFVLDGRTWHTSGVNRTGTSRAGIFAVYTLPWLMPQENWFLSLNPALRQFGSETLQTLFGFRPGVLGRVNGLDRI